MGAGTGTVTVGVRIVFMKIDPFAIKLCEIELESQFWNVHGLGSSTLSIKHLFIPHLLLFSHIFHYLF
jgi:hypothetical protein